MNKYEYTGFLQLLDTISKMEKLEETELGKAIKKCLREAGAVVMPEEKKDENKT